MRCPFCSAEEDTRVTDSRLVVEGNQVRRRRECLTCKKRFTTYEGAALDYPSVVKSDKRREPFNEDKLRGGIMRAFEKLPVELEEIEKAIIEIKKRIRSEGVSEIDSRKIGDWVMTQLQRMDSIAYIRFASVYKRFQDVDAFLKEVERLKSDLSLEALRNQLNLLSSGNEG